MPYVNVKCFKVSCKIIPRTLFCLDESGDVIWTVPEETEAIPLFNCETYEISDTALSRVVVRFGAYAGHVIEFMVRL